ncbi:unnamed protein product [Lathyrus sativus]|nr:unnamed protein product [Lathyrus sativus]
MNFIIQRAESLFRALFEIVLNCGWAQLTEKALNLCKAVTKRVWNVQTPLRPLRQFEELPDYVFTYQEKKDLAWESYYKLSISKAEACCTSASHHSLKFGG